ncbi:integrase core domain-containing protein [Butyricicoccus porcorum]|uniref:integrase core domain-containing protein n=1 Tax=Butyricicoccus porcorum TaxID=1945634 RepID=UPI00241E23D1|nr:integrase core domain-containing protein [Butyricicoccus porcorum]
MSNLASFSDSVEYRLHKILRSAAEAYLTQYNNIREARVAIGQYIHIYNFERRHSALDYQTPAECYYPAMLMPYVA